MRRLRFRLLLVVLIGGVLAGCDSAVSGEETIVLTAEVSTDDQGDPIRFTFQADDYETGRLADVQCGCSLDLGEFLADRGFTKADIVSATVQAARLRMLFPIQERLDFLNRAILKLEASGNSVTEIAELEDFPASAEASLTPRSGRDVAGFVDDGSFEPILQIDPARLLAGREYEIGLVLTIRVEVEGF